MDSWIVGTKLLLLLYCIVRVIFGGTDNVPLNLLLLLVFFSVNILFHILKGANIKKIILAGSIFILFVTAFNLNIMFLIFAPINGAELLWLFKKDIKLSMLPAIFAGAFAIDKIFAEYFLSASFSICVFLMGKILYERISILTDDIDELRIKNDRLYQKISTSAEYENQLRFLSQMEERNKLAQNIHDKVGHAIAGSIIQLEAAAIVVESDREKAGQMIRNVINNLKDGMESIRSTLRNIKPSPEQLGINRLKTVLDEYSASCSIKASLYYSGNVSDISHKQWRIIIDNAREALTNTIKYSAATNVKVRVEVMNKLLKVEVRDNGAGASTIKKGLGLRGMEERVDNAGGKLIIDGSKGFSIIMLLPLNNE